MPTKIIRILSLFILGVALSTILILINSKDLESKKLEEKVELDDTVPCLEQICIKGDVTECITVTPHRARIRSIKNSFIDRQVTILEVTLDTSQECQ